LATSRLSTDPAGAPAGISAMAGRSGRAAVSALQTAVAVVFALGIWEALVRVYGVPIWLLPKPTDFLARLYTDAALIAYHAATTSWTILLGFLLGVLVAVPLALAIVSFGALERGLYPVVVFLNIMPKTVVGPIFVVWFGIGPLVSVFLVFLMCFFPVMVDAMSGFRAVDRRLFFITRSMGATPWQEFRYLRLPAAMGPIYAGMKIGIVKAIEGVIIAEFIASEAGLGYLIMRASGFMDLTLLFAALVATALVALLFNAVLTASERLLVPWARHLQD